MLRRYFFSDAGGQGGVQSDEEVAELVAEDGSRDDVAADDLPDPSSRSRDIPARSGAAQAAGDARPANGQGAKKRGRATAVSDLNI